MLNLFRAEWKKTTGNRCLVGCTIWVWPLLMIGIMAIVLVVLAADTDSRNGLQETPFEWTEIALIGWALPNNLLVRLVLMGFVAAVFTTEYHHSTWKSILPSNARARVILMKFLAIALFIVLAFTITTFILVIGMGFIHTIVGADYPPALSGSVLSDFIEDMLLNMFLTFISIMILSGLAALASIVTRSLLFGVVVSIGLVLVESIGLPIFILIGTEVLKQEWMGNLYLITLSYNTGNIFTWVNLDEAAETGFNGITTLELWQSLAILFFYMFITVGASVFAFQRQDVQ